MSGVYNFPLTGDSSISGGMPVFTAYGLKGLAYSFTSGSGRIVVPEGVTYIADLFAVGAGGGGGSGRVAITTTTTAAAQSGSGGGGGAYARLQNIPVVPGEYIYYSIGTGGTGGNFVSITSSTTTGSNGNNGNAGGATTLNINGTVYVLGGGSGGLAGGSSTTAVVSGGTGGTLTQTGSTPSGATLTTASGGNGASAPSASATAAAVNAGTGVNIFTVGLQNTGSLYPYSQGYYFQNAISTTTLSPTASGTTISTPSTQASAFDGVADLTMTRTALPAGEFSDALKTWSVTLATSAMSAPYAFRMKLVRNNSSGVLQSDSGWGQTFSYNTAFIGNITDSWNWTPGTWSLNDQLALIIDQYRPSGTGNKSMTFTANGSSFVWAPDPTILLGTEGSVGGTGFAGGGATGPSVANSATAYNGGNAGLGGGGSAQSTYISTRNASFIQGGNAGANTGAGGGGSAPNFSINVVNSVTATTGPGGDGANGYLALVFF